MRSILTERTIIMTTMEKIKDRESKIAVCCKRIEKEQQKIKQLQTEIESLKSLEIQGLLKESEIPFEEFVKRFKNLTTRPSSN